MTERISFESAQKKALDMARTRLLVGGALMAAAFLVIGVRLVDVTVFGKTEPSRQSAARSIAVAAKMDRADIVDRNGVLLATSVKDRFAVRRPHSHCRPPGRGARVGAGSARTQRSRSPAEAIVERRIRLAQPAYPRRANNMRSTVWDFLASTSAKKSAEIYPLGRMAVHVVGFTGDDNDGLAGIEHSFEATLTERREPVTLSIDVRVQQIMRRELAAQIEKFKAIGGSGVIIDVRTGEILSLVSLPDFDPHKANTTSKDERFNRTTLGVYELGSVFKIFNHAIALETGAANLKSHYDARKPIRAYGFTISDFHAENRWLSVPEIFMHSSNIGSAKMALRHRQRRAA